LYSASGAAAFFIAFFAAVFFGADFFAAVFLAVALLAVTFFVVVRFLAAAGRVTGRLVAFLVAMPLARCEEHAASCAADQ
jgi:Kef-type K+ transport system membrane component KefB